MITKDEVYTVLANALQAEYPEFYCTQGYDPVPASLPCMYFREFHTRPKNSMTLAYDDNVRSSSVYIELYLRVTDDASAIIELVEQTMNGIYYIEEMCNQIDNIDITLERYSMRFFRKICGGDTL